MNQTGGSVTIGGNLIIASRAGSIGNYNITNGILTASNITLGLGTGSFVITNSTVTVPGKITINAGTSLSFNSGTLSAGSLDFTAHPSGFTGHRHTGHHRHRLLPRNQRTHNPSHQLRPNPLRHHRA